MSHDRRAFDEGARSISMAFLSFSSSAISAPAFVSPSLSLTSSHAPSFLKNQTSQVSKTFTNWSGFCQDSPSSFSMTKESNKVNKTSLQKFGCSIWAAAPITKKRWEKTQVKPNSLPVVRKMHVKVGDTVKIIAGSDKGKVSEVTRVYSHNSNVLIKNINLKTKHVKGKAEGESGQIIQVEAPLHSSNVMLYSKKEKVASRVGHKVLEDGRKVRYLLKTGELLDSPEEWKRLHKRENKDEKKALSIV